jgi:hypothetical protein
MNVRKKLTDAILEALLPEVEKTTLKFWEELCNEKRVELRIYDVRTFTGRMRARFRGVKKTPTIILGENRVEGTPEREQILCLLK